MEINSNDALMVWLINEIGSAYPNQAILKGGMVLRLLDCPRNTNDLDYVFVPFKSKKDILPLLERVLRKLDGANWSHAFHSTALRIQISYKNFRTQIEANVDGDCKSESMSTASLARPNQQLANIVRIMSLDWALAHKLAAWNERGLIRDLFDIYYLTTFFDTKPDLTVLGKRLSDIHVRRTNATKPKKMTLDEFKKKIIKVADKLQQSDIDAELRDTLSNEQRIGLPLKIKHAILKLFT